MECRFLKNNLAASDPFVILLSGKARNGKDTLAEMLKNFYTYGQQKRVLVFHYADYLKYICKQFYNWNGEKDENGRTLLQKVGENYRWKDLNFWVKEAISFLNMEISNYDVVIIPDVRYLNEISLMKDIFECVSIRIERTEENKNFDNGLTEEQKKHPSEIGLDRFCFDLVVKNDGDLNKLETKIASIVKEIEIIRGIKPRAI